MKKDRAANIKIFLPVLAVTLALGFTAPKPALADCEDPAAASAAVATMVPIEMDYVDRFIIQEESYMDNIMRTAFKNLVDYYVEFAKNIEAALTDWASQGWRKGLMDMTRELHLSQVDQSRHLGLLMDAQLMVEEDIRRGNDLVNAQRRYAPSEVACEMDAAGPGLSRSYQISRAINRALALDHAPRYSNAVGTASVTGKGAELNNAWNEYLTKFCDPAMGDPGCTAPGTIAGQHKDLGKLLWGPKMTIDASNPDNMLAIKASMRYLVDPLASDPIPPTAATSTSGHIALLERHSQLAYLNTIYNTLGAMIGERIGGSGVNAQQLRAAAGVAPADASTDASYREIQEAISRDRFNNPDYLVRLIGDPAQVMREQTTLNALRLQTMNDISHRTEERLFMESAGYGRDLNAQIPKAATSQAPLPP